MKKSFMDKLLTGLEKDEFIRTRLAGKLASALVPGKKSVCFRQLPLPAGKSHCSAGNVKNIQQQHNL
jgi:hypothetical protein